MERDLGNEYSVDKENIWKRVYLYRDKLKGIYDSKPDNETLGIIFRALIEHIINYGEEPEINNFAAKLAYNLIVADIDRDKAAYILKCKQNHENALKGKKANASDGIRTIADKDKDKDNDNDTDKDTDKDKEKKEKKSLSLSKESDRGKNKNLFFELSEGEQKEYLKKWLTENFYLDSDKVDGEVQKRLFYILGNVKDKTKTIDDMKNYVCSYWANISKLEYKEPEKEPEEEPEEENSWFDNLVDESEMSDEEREKMAQEREISNKKWVAGMAYAYIEEQIEKGEPIDEYNVKNVNDLREFLTTEELEYLQKHGIVD